MIDISKFLIEAKKNTYASGSSIKKELSRMGSKNYYYEGFIENKKAIYHDTFFGGENFIGEETVYLDDEKPIWGMNYYGFAIEKGLSREAMNKALRPALMKVGEDSRVLPLRGPSEFKIGEYFYTFNSQGTLDNFTGVEKIYLNNKLIYELHCSGGILG